MPLLPLEGDSASLLRAIRDELLKLLNADLTTIDDANDPSKLQNHDTVRDRQYVVHVVIDVENTQAVVPGAADGLKDVASLPNR